MRIYESVTYELGKGGDMKQPRIKDLFKVADEMANNCQSREIRVSGYPRIVEWLYTHDGEFNSRNEWREELLKVIKENL